MQAMIDELAKQAEESLGQVSSKETLATFWQEYLSKNGKIPALMKNLRSVAPEERPAMGKIINELKAKVQAEYDAAAGLFLPSVAACPAKIPPHRQAADCPPAPEARPIWRRVSSVCAAGDPPDDIPAHQRSG